MIEQSLNIVGSEWIIIIFVVLILFLGSSHMPGAAKKLGKVVANSTMQEQTLKIR